MTSTAGSFALYKDSTSHEYDWSIQFGWKYLYNCLKQPCFGLENDEIYRLWALFSRIRMIHMTHDATS